MSACAVQHYPARLQQLFILELPIILRWVLGAVKHMIHPSTAARIRTCSAVENCLPLPLSVLDEHMSTSVRPRHHLSWMHVRHLQAGHEMSTSAGVLKV